MRNQGDNKKYRKMAHPFQGASPIQGELLQARRDPMLWAVMTLAFWALVFAALAYLGAEDVRRMMREDRMYPQPACDRCGGHSCCAACCEEEGERNKEEGESKR